MRVHELAKELNLTSKDVIAKLHDMDVEAKNHMSTIEDIAVELLREECGRGKSKPVSAPAAAPVAGGKDSAQKEKPSSAPKSDKKEKPAEPKVPESEEDDDIVLDGKTIRIRGPVFVKNLAEVLELRPNKLIAELMGMNIFAAINDRLEANIARKIIEQHGFAFEQEKRVMVHKEVVSKPGDQKEDAPADLVPRSPVVTFLGHVDHGKTSLLDKIRNTAVTQSEWGGITQHIGAYTVQVGGRSITFLDTPGHAAFTAMRARGANLTDIAVIIIAADDGIMPQTKEAIKHAQAAEVSLMVAINKMDLPSANEMLVKKQLQAEGLVAEEWGGAVICCPVSAQTGKGIDHLLDMILLQADMLELKANPNRRAQGFVIEARLEPGMGPTANLLVTNGTLKMGDVILCGSYCGKVRALVNDHGIKVKTAGPSTPIKCLGLSGVPEAGAKFMICTDEKEARILAEVDAKKEKAIQLAVPQKISLENIFTQMQENSQKMELRVILKADTQGSVEAISHALEDIKSDKVSMNVILSTTGNITTNDVMLASASNAIILGFHVGKEAGVVAQAKHEGVEIRVYEIIYQLIDQVRDTMTGLIAPKYQEIPRGRAVVKQVFGGGKRGKIAGSLVVQGYVKPKFKARLKRGEEVLHEGTVVSLKRFQESTDQVKESQECGIRLESHIDFIEGDILEFFEVEEIKQTL